MVAAKYPHTSTMSSSIECLFDKLSTKPRRIFLIDSLGALVTAFLLSFVLAPYERFFGMPRAVLYDLASVACVFALYSACCYFFAGKSWRICLKIIALANGIYGCATLVLAVCYYHSLHLGGLAYFFLESLVMSALLWLEYALIKRTT